MIRIQRITAILAVLVALTAAGTASAQVHVNGNVFGGGNNADVMTNTAVNISAGQVEGNVYGGGNVGDVGTINKTNIRAYKWTDEATPGDDYIYNNTGSCSVSITGGTIGANSTGGTGTTPGSSASDESKGNVFGAGKGVANSFWCEKAMVYKTEVSISNGTVNGNVYGGGEIGRVEMNTTVTIGVAPGTGGEKSEPEIKGDVFGAGKGLETHGYSALVRGNTTVLVQEEAKVGHSVYGGGEIATVGKYNLVTKENKDEHPGLEVGMPYSIVSDNLGICTVTVNGKAQIGSGAQGGDVFGAGKGVAPETYSYSDKDNMPRRMMTYNAEDYTEGNKETWEYAEDYADGYTGSKYIWEYFDTTEKYMTFVETLALATQTTVVIGGEAQVKGSVFGGSESGFVQHHAQISVKDSCGIGTSLVEGNVYGGGRGISGNHSAGRASGNTTVSILGGTMTGSVYGGGALASSNKGWDNTMYSAKVSLKGGTVTGNVYGGGMGDASTAATVGNALVELNKDVAVDTKGCVVKGSIFGCNNVNGTPLGTATVHVYKTQHEGAGSIETKSKGNYDVTAVYGGGNLAAYEPEATQTSGTDEEKEASKPAAKVIIEGCALTSIQTVYGGGNAASTPATDIEVIGTYEINELFGGGNGKDAIDENTPNPGANVGYKDYHLVEDQFTTKESRTEGDGFAPYRYGSGVATVNIKGGTIHYVFGGSNTKGNVRQTALTMLEEEGGCPFCVDEAYGGGKSAPMDAEAKLLMACIPGLEAAYGGAEAADIQGDVTLTITNGTFDRVFGGNNISGTIRGSIQVNIEETGCKPIIIGQLYGGGNQAAYSVYGYDSDDKPLESGSNPCKDPEVNVRSFTSIGDIFGGGLGEGALLVGNPTVNIDVALGEHSDLVVAEGFETPKHYPVPSHQAGKIGAINNVYGGGNAAVVKGNTHVNIGTKAKENVYMAIYKETGASVSGLYTRSGEGNYEEASGPAMAGTTYYKKYTYEGVDIRGNVYGGGNEAEVSGDTNVQIGKEI